MTYCTIEKIKNLGFIDPNNFIPYERYKINDKLYLYTIKHDVVLLGKYNELPYNDIETLPIEYALFDYNFKFLFEELKFNKKYKELHNIIKDILKNFNNLYNYSNKSIYEYCSKLNISKENKEKLKLILL